MWYIFPKSKKTILENQRVMRLKAASWVKAQAEAAGLAVGEYIEARLMEKK